MSEHFKIHKELESLLPPLDEQELKQLEDNVLEDGIREPLIVARVKGKELLCDGHNRLSIARKFDLSYELKYVEFASLVDVKVWMIRNQKGRRNLSDGWQYDIMLVLKKLLLMKGKEKMKIPTGNPKKMTLSTIDKVKDHNTRDEIAKELNWSTGKVAMADRVWKDAPKEVVEDVKAGKTTISQAYKDVKKEEKKEKLKQKKIAYESKIETTTGSAIDIFTTDQKFRVVYADPPWSYNDTKKDYGHGAANDHYHTMPLNDICALPIRNITSDNAVLFIWVTSPLLEDVFQIIKAWGFRYKTSFVWDKVKHNMGHYNSVRHELLLICTKGSCVPDSNVLIDSVQSIERNDKHSSKPQKFVSIIDDMYTHGDRIELFSRGNDNKKWKSWGNEV